MKAILSGLLCNRQIRKIMKKKLSLILILFMIAALALTLFACSNKTPNDDEEDPKPSKEKYTVSQAMSYTYDGLMAGNEALKANKVYSVDSCYTIYTKIVNYTIIYKANYAENPQDSEIYLSIIDNGQFQNRVSLYYDGHNLFILSDAEKKYVKDFSYTAMFDSFFTLIRHADLSSQVFSEKGAYIFNKEDASLNIGLVIDASNIKHVKVSETKDSLEYNDISLDIISDTVNTYMDNYLSEIGTKFDVLTKKYLDFSLSRAVESRFAYIHINEMNFQRDSGVANYFKVDASGSFRDASKYKMDAEIGYNLNGKTDIKEKANYSESKFTNIQLGKNNYVGSIFIPSLSKEDFDISVVTDFDTKENKNNKLSVDIIDAQGNYLFGSYYRDQVAYVDASGFENQYIKGAIDIAAFNLPKVFFDGINLTNLINAFYNSGMRMAATIFDRGLGDISGGNEDLYQIIMENFGNEGNTIYYKINEKLIKKLRQDDTRVAKLVADALNIPVEKIDSMLGENFFGLSELRISYNLDTGTVGVSYHYDDELIFRATLNKKPFTNVTFPNDTVPESYAYKNLIVPDNVKSQINVEFKVSNGKEYSDMSKLLGAFIGDSSGKNTPYKISKDETIILEMQASESFVAFSGSGLVSEYKLRYDLYSQKAGEDKKILMSLYTNPKNADELLIKYVMPLGINNYADGIKYKIKKSEVGEALSTIIGNKNLFTGDVSLETIRALLEGNTINNYGDGYFTALLQVSRDSNTNTIIDPVKEILGVSDLSAKIKTKILFAEVLLNDIDPTNYFIPSINDSTFESPVQISSLYSPNSNWKDSINVYFNEMIIAMRPNYDKESIKIGGDRKTYNPVCKLFGLTTDYILSISTDIGTYTVQDLANYIIEIDPAFTDKLPSAIEVIFTNGKTGVLACKIKDLTNEVVTHAGLNLNVFANEKTIKYTLTIGENSILTKDFEVYIAVHNRTVLPLIENGEKMTDSQNVPVIGVLSLDPYAYAMKKTDNSSYNPIKEGILKHNMLLNFYNVYGINPETLAELTFNMEGGNYFYLSKLNLDWQFDESKIKYNGGVLYAYAFYGAGRTAVKIAIRVDVAAKVVNHVKINNEDINKYTIDSLVTSSYAIPTQTGVGTEVKVYFKDNSFRIIRINRPEGLTDDEYYSGYLPTELAWYIPNKDYMKNVSLEYGANALFGAVMGNSTYADISIGSLGTDRIYLYVEVPERRESTSDLGSANAVRKIINNGDGTYSLSKVTSVQLSPITFTQGAELYEYYSINPYDEEAKLPNHIFMKVYKQYSNKNETVMKKYKITWLDTAGIGGEDTNILYINDDGYAKLAHPTTDENYFYIYGVVGDGNFTVTVKARVKNLASELKSIHYDGMDLDVANIIIDPYKSYTLPLGFTATLASGEKVYRNNIEWEVLREGDTEWMPVKKAEGRILDETLYDSKGKYLFSHQGGNYLLRYILEASGSVLSQSLYISVEVLPRTIVADTINIYDTGTLVTGYEEINYYKKESHMLYNRIVALMNDSGKTLTVGIGFEEARTDLILDRYNLLVDFVRAQYGQAEYENSLDYLEYILKNPEGGETVLLKGTIFTGTINEQEIVVRFSLASLVISNITLINAEYSESTGAVILPQKESDGRIGMQKVKNEGELIINIPKIFALTIPVDNLERYASPYQYINHIFGRIIMMYYNGITDNDILPELDFGTYTEKTFNQKVLGIIDNLYMPTQETITYIKIKRLSEGSAAENITVKIVAKVDVRESTGRNIMADIYNESGESCGAEGYSLPTFIDVPYINSGVVRYYLAQSGWIIGDNYIADFGGARTTRSIGLNLIRVLTREAISYGFYYILPMQGLKDGTQDEGYYYLTVNIPRKNINNINYNAKASESMYDINKGYISISNAYLFYDENASYNSGGNSYKTGFDYTLLPDLITAEIITDWFDSTSYNSFNVSWIPEKNAIIEADVVNGILREHKRVLATATISSYYNESGEHVTQTIIVYVEMEKMVFTGLEYSIDGNSLDIRKDEQGISNTIVIDPYDENMGYNGIFKLPTVGLKLNFENNESFMVTPSADSQGDNPITSHIKRFELLDNDLKVIRYITEIPYSYNGYNLSDSNLPINGLLYINMVMFTGQNITLTINILSRVVDKANISNIVVKNEQTVSIELPKLYYIDPYNSITHRLPAYASVFFLNSDNFTTLPIARWEIFDENSGKFADVSNIPYFYIQTSASDSTIKYAYYLNGSDGYKGGIYRAKAYIAMGISKSGINIGEQGFEVTVIILNRTLKNSYFTSYEYQDPIAGLLSDIGGELTNDMFVDYDKYYAAEFARQNLPQSIYYSNISDGPVVPSIDWSRYVDDSVISYEGFNNKEINGYLYYANTNIDYLYNTYRQQVSTIYAELIKAMTWDAFFVKENGILTPLNYYSSTTANNLRMLALELEMEVKNQTFYKVIDKFVASEKTAYLAKRMENTLLRSVMSNNENLSSESEGIAFLYDMLKADYAANRIKDDDRIIYLNWLDMYNIFKGNNPGYVENIDAENLTEYQKLKRDMYNKAYANLYFYGDEDTYNEALYAEKANKLNNYINSAIYLKIYNMATKDERLRMSQILGDNDSAAARSYALTAFIAERLKLLGSYGEKASAIVSAPSVSFDKLVDSLGEQLDTFYFNIYTTLSLDTEVEAWFLYNKERIFKDLIENALASVIESYREGIISSSLADYFEILKAQIINEIVPKNEQDEKLEFYYDGQNHIFDYAIIGGAYEQNEKNQAAITTYRDYVREKAISHINPEKTAQENWASLYGAYVLKKNTQMVSEMDRIYNASASYDEALTTFKTLLMDLASQKYDIHIAKSNKTVNASAVDSLINNPSIATGNNSIASYQVFMAVYGGIIGLGGDTTHIYTIVRNSLNESARADMENRRLNYTGTNTYMQTIYYYLYDSGADSNIKRITQDIFYMMTGLGAGYDALLDRVGELVNFESLETVTAYLQKLEINKDTYDSILTEEQFIKIKKARVFRQLQSFYSSGTNIAKTIMQEIYDSIYLEIKSNAYNALYNGLFAGYKPGMENVKNAQGNPYAMAFRALIKNYEKQAAITIEGYKTQIKNYGQSILYRHTETLFNKMYDTGAFEYAISADDNRIINYLDFTNTEQQEIKKSAVNYYVKHIASLDEKLKINAASALFGEYWTGGAYSAPNGVYDYLTISYDMGELFINTLKSLYYQCALEYAENKILSVIIEVISDPRNAQTTQGNSVYINYYNNYYAKLKQVSSINGSSDSPALVQKAHEFALKDYIDYETKQNILYNYIIAKETLYNEALMLAGERKVYNEIYPQCKAELDGILESKYMAQAADSRTRYYTAYNLLKSKLLDDALKIVNESVEKINAREGYIKIFDKLNISEWISEEAFPANKLESFRAQWNNAVNNPEYRPLFLNLLGEDIDRIYESFEMTLSLAEALYGIDDFGDITLVAKELLSSYELLANKYDDVYNSSNIETKNCLEAVYRQEALRKGREIKESDTPYLKIRAIARFIELKSYASANIAYTINYDLLIITDIEMNTRTIFNDAAKEEYLNKFITYLNEQGYYILASYIGKLIKDNYYITDFVAIDNYEGMTEEELNAYMEELSKYKVYLNKIYELLKLTSAAGLAESYKEYINNGKFLSSIEDGESRKISINLTEAYLQGISGTSDESFMSVFERMTGTSTLSYTFYTKDHIAPNALPGDKEKRHMIYFDVQILQEEENSSTQDINKLYLTNASKQNNALTLIKQDGFRFVYPQIEIIYVDYYDKTTLSDAQTKYSGDSTANSKYINKITIDPLNPDLPEKVHAYGVYQGTDSVFKIIDVGMVKINYDNIFRSLEDEFAGNAEEGDSSSSYQITAINDRGGAFLISLTVYYLDRTVKSYYVPNAGYTSLSNLVGGSGEYSKFYNLYDTIKNYSKMTIDPTLEDMVDIANGTYKLPNAAVANYKSNQSDTYRMGSASTIFYYNIKWDLTNINYSLSGLNETQLRILSYCTSNGDGTYNKLTFNYASNQMIISKYNEADNSRISENIFTGTPSKSIWNITLTVNSKTVDKVYIKQEDGSNKLLAKFVSMDISGEGSNERWLVAESDYTINPYYVEFYKNLVLEFSDGDTYEVLGDKAWHYHPTNGANKLQEIVNKTITEPNNRYIVAGFNYISETIWIKLMVDDIEIVRPSIDDGSGNMVKGYIDGGTIYLLAKTGDYNVEKEVQLSSFYSYMYYNFSNDKYSEDWRKVPLIFSSNSIRSIVLNEGNVYPNILATLGHNSSSFNISFTIKVISPKLYASVSGDRNEFVTYDRISMPVDGNSRVISSSSDMPQMLGSYFVQLNGDGEDALFYILNTSYDVVNEKVTYECRYYMSNASDKIAGGENGIKTLSFKVVIPLMTYNYNNITNIKFETKAGNNYSWNTVNKHDEPDSLIWKLGSKMKPGLLPKGYDTVTGEVIEFLWDLDNININLATGAGGYYTIKAYYYASTAQWLYKEVNVYILKEDLSETIAPLTNLSKTYDGNDYSYVLDYSNLVKLRIDGTLMPLPEQNFVIEYRTQSSSEYNYSTTYRPLNAGVYYIRITLDDYNYYGVIIITLTINPYQIKGTVPKGIGEELGITTDIVFAGADANNYVHYIYNGGTQGLVVSSGLPYVKVQNWPQTKDEKDRLYISKLGQNPTDTEIMLAKSAAFNELFGRVTPATQTYLSRFKAKIKETYGINNENELNAKVFDTLDYNLYICEVVPTVIYKNINDVILEKEPVDVGTYLVTYNIEAAKNNGNYILDTRTNPIAARIIIEKQSLSYSLASDVMVYNGKYQDPLINNLHLPNGKLPIGVSVVYEYSYISNLVKVTTNQIRNVGTYSLVITIDGGNNYPSDIIRNLTVSIVPHDLLISFNEEKTRSKYLDSITDYGKHLIFEGLVGNDKALDFYEPITSGNVFDYYTLGKYPLMINGFKIDKEDIHMYTKCNLEEIFEINGREYYKLILKTAIEEGSLYSKLDENNNYIYQSLINKFTNYNIYIAKENWYTIYPDGEAIIVDTDAELQDAIAAVPENGRATIYLSEGVYSKLYINKNASITIIGCYNENREIISLLDGIAITEGEVVLKIIKINGKTGEDSVYIGDYTGMVSVLECELDGLDCPSSRAIVTSDGYGGLLYINNTTIKRYTRAIELLNGNAEINSSIFISNKFGISVYTELEAYIRSCQFINTSNEALMLEGESIILLECHFSGNLVAVQGRESVKATVMAQNTFYTNGIDFKVKIYS